VGRERERERGGAQTEDGTLACFRGRADLISNQKKKKIISSSWLSLFWPLFVNRRLIKRKRNIERGQ